MKVLIVDDAPINLRLLRAVLEGEAVEVVEACDGAQALELLTHQPVDAVISDILMPRVDGYRLCQEVRRRWRDMPFIFYSATYTSEGDEKLCYDMGGDKFLRKPSPPNELMAALDEATHGAARHGAHRPIISESEVTKEYSERLVCKLEEKNRDLVQRTGELEQAKAELQKANEDLERRVKLRTAELEAAYQELESFSYSVSHDLRSPLNHIRGYIDLLMRSCADKLDEESRKHFETVRGAAKRMGDLIHALLDLSKLARSEIESNPVDLSFLAGEVIAELQLTDPKRVVKVEIAPNLLAHGDRRLLRAVVANLLGNAWKYSRKQAEARIVFGKMPGAAADVFFVRDNGAGFDMNYADKLFHPFQRLHGSHDFEGNGIGLATVHRIVTRHHGKIWAESAEGKGATFFFTIGAAAGNGAPPGNCN
jgi:signal transduction histidine kinase